MDAGLLGGLIGAGVFFGGCSLFYFFDIYYKNKKNKSTIPNNNILYF